MRWWYREKKMQPKLWSITGKAGDLKGVPFGGFEWRPNCCHPRGSHRRVPGDDADGQREGGGGILIPRYMAHTTNQKQARHSDKATGRRGRGGEGTGKWPWRSARAEERPEGKPPPPPAPLIPRETNCRRAYLVRAPENEGSGSAGRGRRGEKKVAQIMEGTGQRRAEAFTSPRGPATREPPHKVEQVGGLGKATAWSWEGRTAYAKARESGLATCTDNGVLYISSKGGRKYMEGRGSVAAWGLPSEARPPHSLPRVRLRGSVARWKAHQKYVQQEYSHIV